MLYASVVMRCLSHKVDDIQGLNGTLRARHHIANRREEMCRVDVIYAMSNYVTKCVNDASAGDVHAQKVYPKTNTKEMKQRPRSITLFKKSQQIQSSNHCALLVFIAARGWLDLSGSPGRHVVLAWVKDEARVTNVEEDRSERDHAM
jgi:hypothetical protein